MKCRILFILSVLFIHISTTAQTPSPSPSPPRPGSPILDDNARFERLRSIELIGPRDKTADSHPLLNSKKGIYRKPGKDEIQILAVDPPLLSRYAAFLRDSNTGIVKLNADSACVSNTEVLIVTENCLNYQMPGAGTAYSFRTESYRLPRLADLILADGIFKADGVFQHVIMVELGDIAIPDVTLQTNGMKYLADFKPTRDGESFLEFDSKLAKGIEADAFQYRKGFAMNEQTTFALRSVAYKGAYIRSVDGIPYNELDYDRRRDVIVAFRVVDKDEFGNITIVWKRLRDSGSPTLRVNK